MSSRHALPLVQQRKRVGADAVPQTHGFHAGDHGGQQFFAPLGQFALGHNGFKVGHSLP